MQTVIGWDIGGAHLKAARADNGVITRAAQIASPLWLGLEELDRAFAAAQAEIGTASRHAITMTGELCDSFATRDEGVAGLAEIAARCVAPAHAFFYAGRAGFVELAGVGAHAREIASANWHASAALTGLRAPDALLIDIGSTTTDIIPVAGGVPAALGASDAQRLARGELVYTGLVRTFLMAGPKLVPFEGGWTPLMNEWFASMSDVYRILGQLPDAADLMDTPDGREKTVAASRARLARMIGRDAGDADDAAWERLARFFAETQMREIMDAAALVLSRAVVGPGAPIVGAGCGRDIVRQLAARMERPYLAFDDLIETVPDARGKASDCAGACAMALIGARQWSL